MDYMGRYLESAERVLMCVCYSDHRILELERELRTGFPPPHFSDVEKETKELQELANVYTAS